jgi:hypothetical protein
MRKLLYSATALAFMAAPLHMAAPVYAEPVKMTSAQLDEVTAGGLKKKHHEKRFNVKIRNAAVAVNVIADTEITGSIVNQVNVILQEVELGKNARIVFRFDGGKVSYKKT